MRTRILAALVALLAGSAQAQVNMGAIQYTPPPTAAFTGGAITTAILGPAADNCTAPPFSFAGQTTSGLCSPAAGTVAIRIGGVNTALVMAGQLSLRNGTSATSILANNTYTDASNYERGYFRWVGNKLEVGAEAAGTGTARAMGFSASFFTFAGTIYPAVADSGAIGFSTTPFALATISRAIVGSKSKALTDNVATNFVDVAIPQTAGANFAGGSIGYTIVCRDAANQATQRGMVEFACHNRAGTEACTIGTPTVSTLGDGTASLGTPAFTAAGGTDAVAFSVQSDCTGVTPTAHTILYRLNMEQVNTVTPK